MQLLAAFSASVSHLAVPKLETRSPVESYDSSLTPSHEAAVRNIHFGGVHMFEIC